MELTPILIGLGVIAALAVIGGLIYVGLREQGDVDPLSERLAQFGEREMPESLEKVELSLSFQDRVLYPLLRTIGKLVTQFTPQQQIETIRQRIDMAGLGGQIEPSVFFAFRILATVTLALGAFLVFFVLTNTFSTLISFAFVAGFTLVGYFFPSLFLSSRISRRQNNVVRALPDALDLLVICVEAGLGFDAAMGKVYEKWDNELAIAFGRALREIQLGKSRKEALKDMSTRMDVPDVTAFIAAILQADSLGVSMGKILRVQSDQMRVKRRQRAQEKAHQAPVKMMIPMVFLIFPSMYIVLLGPAVIKILESGTLNMGIF